MTNKNEREWYNGHAARIVQAIQLRGDREGAYERLNELVKEAEKRERARVLEEVNTMINKHARKEAGNDLLVVPLGIAVLGLVSLQSKDGKKG